ncbi:SDR family NAD(P)-dependent oxidoreductase [Rhizobium binxianense]
MELNDKVALVTGAGSGIGRASAIRLARGGAKVMLVDLEAAKAGLDATTEAIRSAGGSTEQAIADVTDPVSFGKAVQDCITAFGRLDIAHNNAGVTGLAFDFAELPVEEATRIMAVNFWGVFHCLQAEIPQMLSQGGGGTIVNTASSAGVVAVPHFSAYTASKHAVVGLTKTVAAEYAGRGIRINAVCPGFVETPMTARHNDNPELLRAMLAMHPIGRFARPEEVAEAVFWLASPASSYAVGANLLLDGGYSLA